MNIAWHTVDSANNPNPRIKKNCFTPLLMVVQDGQAMCVYWASSVCRVPWFDIQRVIRNPGISEAQALQEGSKQIEADEQEFKGQMESAVLEAFMERSQKEGPKYNNYDVNEPLTGFVFANNAPFVLAMEENGKMLGWKVSKKVGMAIASGLYWIDENLSNGKSVEELQRKTA